MLGNRRTWTAALVLLAALVVPVLVVPAQKAAAQGSLDFKPGEVCPFSLTVTFEGGHQNTVDHTISAGTGSTLTFINDESGKSVTYQSAGSMTRSTLNPDGTTTTSLQGWNAVLLFPTTT